MFASCVRCLLLPVKGIDGVLIVFVLGANWTTGQAAGSLVDLVPEPATLPLLAMSVLMVGRRRRG